MPARSWLDVPDRPAHTVRTVAIDREAGRGFGGGIEPIERFVAADPEKAGPVFENKIEESPRPGSSGGQRSRRYDLNWLPSYRFSTPEVLNHKNPWSSWRMSRICPGDKPSLLVRWAKRMSLPSLTASFTNSGSAALGVEAS